MKVARELVLSAKELAERMGTPWRTFEKWLYPSDDPDYRDMPGAIWVLGTEILAHEKLKRANHNQAQLSIYVKLGCGCEAGIKTNFARLTAERRATIYKEAVAQGMRCPYQIGHIGRQHVVAYLGTEPQ